MRADQEKPPSFDDITARIVKSSHFQEYVGKTVVIKYGGHAMGKEGALPFARDIVALKQAGVKPVLVHGGGPQIGKMLERLGIKSTFQDGLRVTDEATVEVAEMVLSGAINKSLVSAINRCGGRAIGLSGKDGNLVLAEKYRSRKEVDLGFVGEPKQVSTDLLERLLDADFIPVLAPIAGSENGETYNVNADTFAGAIAGALKAKRLLLLTDIAGVLDGKRELISVLGKSEAQALVDQGVATGGMIPKIQACLYALEKGVEGVVILDGRAPHAAAEALICGRGAGTLIQA